MIVILLPMPTETRWLISAVFLTGVIALTAPCPANGADSADSADRTTINIIPRPFRLTVGAGVFRIDSRTTICPASNSTQTQTIAKYLAEVVYSSAGFEPQIRQSAGNLPEPNAITLTLANRPDLGDEGYILSVRPDSILIRASRPAGLFYAVQTIRQLLPPKLENGVPALTIACVEIEDRPAFAWRGLLLDCSRTFLSKQYIIRYIDLLAFYKMNVLHLHLTDDQGWRLEIKKYPKLAEICSKFSDSYPEEKSGFYSQDDIRQIVEYAGQRFVTIVPEIEMPGHSSSVFAAYPNLSCAGRKTEIFPFFKGPNITTSIFCAGNDDVYAFLEDVLAEVIELFPSRYIHIGGDEAPKDNWKQCPKCQARIKREGLRDEEHLQSYFTQRIEKFLNSKGRTLIGWDEILEGGLAPNAAVMSWRGIEGGVKAAQMGHPVVMSPTSHCYFDYDVNTTPLRKTYSFNPIPGQLPADKRRLILGGQGNMWTHIARTEDAIDRQIFPRLIALSEALWASPEPRDFNDFHRRLQMHHSRLDTLGVKSGPEK